MPFSSMIQEMKGKIGAISLRGVLRFRPGGHAGAGRAPAAEPDEASREGCWAQLPFELLRPPSRLCACRRLLGNSPSPSLKQPGPRDAPLKCFIRRDRAAQSYSLCLGVTDGLADDGKFLLAARKCRRPACTEYLISLDAKNTSAGSYIGKLRAAATLGSSYIPGPAGEDQAAAGRDRAVAGGGAGHAQRFPGPQPRRDGGQEHPKSDVVRKEGGDTRVEIYYAACTSTVMARGM
uniref:Tubby C-terminal domain-containing protein n=1 Tax=Zea mays TaxID=4577 RepID=A0A804UJV6_MAIZE